MNAKPLTATPSKRKARAKPHGGVGNQNAAKENPRNTIINAACRADEKARWQKLAESRGVTLSKLIRNLLDKEVKKELNK